ncbi:MAG: DNA-processing protein DprA [Desulfobacterales bacterium]
MTATAEEILPWLHLQRLPGIGNLLYKRLIDRFGTAAAVLQAEPEAWREVEGMNGRAMEALRRKPSPDPALLASIRAWLKKGIRVVTLADCDYPPLLREIPDPPPVLFARGEPAAVGAFPVAVVGSRRPTRYGRDMAHRLAGDLARRGCTVVSGLAFGIDAAAHEGALAAGGKTVAVLGSGLERIYPAEHGPLAKRLLDGGALFSEFAPEAAPEAWRFPVRNRVISGLSLGCVVVEAGARSGALITARLAADQGREVFAVPGSVASPRSAGTHGLIKQGAKLVENVEDILVELGFPAPGESADPPATGTRPSAPAEPLTPEETEVLQALGPYPLHIDELGRSLGKDAGTLSSLLLQLELKGAALSHPGKYYTAAFRPPGGRP